MKIAQLKNVMDKQAWVLWERLYDRLDWRLYGRLRDRLRWRLQWRLWRLPEAK